VVVSFPVDTDKVDWSITIYAFAKMLTPGGYSTVKFANDRSKTTGLIMYSAWGCPHEVDGLCIRVKQRRCDPGMKGCVLYGRFAFSDPDKNSLAIRRKQAERTRKDR
jgi:hypothetical protein